MKISQLKPEVNARCFAQLVNVVDKKWGREEWIVNNKKYCGKKLIIKKGYRCSMHYHKIKEETFYILYGKILFESKYEGKNESKVMLPGDIVHINPLMVHRFTGLEVSEIIEFSTHHMDEDSYREELSGKIDLSRLNM